MIISITTIYLTDYYTATMCILCENNGN